MKHRVLFVSTKADDLRRTLESGQHQWNAVFADNGATALEIVSTTNVDVIVTDVETGMDEIELLDTVHELQPKILRIVLSDESERDKLLCSTAPVHQIIPKPFNPEALKTALERTVAVFDVINNDDLKSRISKIKLLPSPPQLYLDLNRELRSTDVTMTKLGELIATDVALTAKILQLVNSAFFGLRVTISDPVHAAKMLGTSTLRALVLSLEVFSKFAQVDSASFSVAKLLDHSQIVGAFAKAIFETEIRERHSASDALSAGILHDVGKLVLAVNFTDEYTAALDLAKRERIPLTEAEQTVFSATHAEVGAYLLGLWGLPGSIVEALAFHHNPQKSSGKRFSALTAVHVAEALEHDIHKDQYETNGAAIDKDYLSELDMIDRLPLWRERCEELLTEKAL